MKKIIEYCFALLSIAVCARAYAVGSIQAYQGERGDALLISSARGEVIMILGGAVPRGAATASDCFAEAGLSLKKSPNYYEGDFMPVHNEISEMTREEIDGKGIGLYVFEKKIRVGGAEVAGMCADGIEFSGEYRELSKGSETYKKKFLRFMSLSHQNAKNLFSHQDVTGALAEIGPFVGAYEQDWLNNSADARVLIPVINDYAFFLQTAGRDDEALPLLRLITNRQPQRTVAWLNIGDTYWQLGRLDDARKGYAEYVKRMTDSGMAAKIPTRAIERAKK